MIGNAELLSLVQRVAATGAQVSATFDPEHAKDGRLVIASVTITGATGIGTIPMPPVAAAECMRKYLADWNAKEANIIGGWTGGNPYP